MLLLSFLLIDITKKQIFLEKKTSNKIRKKKYCTRHVLHIYLTHFIHSLNDTMKLLPFQTRVNTFLVVIDTSYYNRLCFCLQIDKRKKEEFFQ